MRTIRRFHFCADTNTSCDQTFTIQLRLICCCCSRYLDDIIFLIQVITYKAREIRYMCVYCWFSMEENVQCAQGERRLDDNGK